MRSIIANCLIQQKKMLNNRELYDNLVFYKVDTTLTITTIGGIIKI